MADICCIGHIPSTKSSHRNSPPTCRAARHITSPKALKKNFNHTGFKLVTSLGKERDVDSRELRGEGIDVEVIPSRRTVYFENKYGEKYRRPHTARSRKSRPVYKREAAKTSKHGYSTSAHLTADDFSLDVIKELSARGLVSVDVQDICAG